MERAVLLFDDIIALDAVGPIDVSNRLPGTQVKIVAEQADPPPNPGENPLPPRLRNECW